MAHTRMLTHRDRMPYGLPMLTAILLGLSFYPWQQEWVVWIACAPLLVWLMDPAVSWRRAIPMLVFVGTVYHLTLLAPFLSLGWWGWGTTTGGQLSEYFSYQRWFLIIILGFVSLWGGLVLACIGLLIRPSLRKPLLSLWVVPSVWVFVLEYLGHGSVFGFSWGLIGNRLHGLTSIRQLASLTGVYGLSFLVLMVNALGASWLMTLRRKDISRQLIEATTIMAAVMVAVVGYGQLALRAHPESGPVLHAVLLQGASAPVSSGDFSPEGMDLRYESMVREAVGRHPDLVLLPETIWLRPLQLDGSTNPWSSNPLPLAQMQEVLRGRFGGPTLLGMGLDVVSEGRTYNATTFWHAGQLAGLYRKRRLVPFAEYHPAVLGRWAPQNRIHGPQFTYTPGQGSQLFREGSVIIGAFICQEVMFPGLVRQTVKDGAQLLVSTGNDGVFASPIVAWEQANLATLRAVENRRCLLRSMKTGISAAIDPYGRVLSQAPVNTQAVLSGEVYGLTALTWYTRWGDWIAWVSGLIVLLSLAGWLRVRYT